MKPLDPAWTAYVPNERQPWNGRRVVHLHQRAGFGATWAELQRDLKDGPTASVNRFLEGKQTLHVAEHFTTTANLLGESAVSSGEIARLKAWWCYRLLFTPDPLREKLALHWHNHFATSNAKVQNPAAMKRQNDVFRQRALGSFRNLVNDSVRQPALLEYLDAPSNRRGHPNENLARELMELFTLGVGHYTENDVKEAARALTGWNVQDGQFTHVAVRHDDGHKTILNKTAPFDGSQLVTLLLEQPATAQRLAARLCETLMGEQTVTPAMQRSLADGLRERQLDVGWAVKTILQSTAFYADNNLGTRILSPVEYLIGAARRLEMFDPAPSTLALGDWCGRMGQDLFEPPNVGGWKGGRAWISARAMIARANGITALVEGQHLGRSAAYDPIALPTRYGLKTDASDVIAFHTELLLGVRPTPALLNRLSKAHGRAMVSTLLTLPESQLG